MIIQVLATPLGQVATVRERRGGSIEWESAPLPTAEEARRAAIAWIQEEPTDLHSAFGIATPSPIITAITETDNNQ